MSIQSDNSADRVDPSEAIHALSERYHVDESTVRKMYERKWEELSFHATITAFLPVLIERHVKDLLEYSH